MNTMFTTLLAAAGARVEIPVDGSTGVWLKQGATVISSGMRMTGAVVSSGQSQRIYNRGVAVSCFISASGTQYVSSGGRALYTSGYGVAAIVYVYNGGIASGGQMEYGGTVRVSRGGSVVGMTFQNGGNLQVSSGGTGLSVVLPSSGGRGAVRVYNGGLVSGAHIIYGNGYVYAGGTAASFRLESGCSLTVDSGGTALAVTSDAGAVIVVSDGGYIEYA